MFGSRPKVWPARLHHGAVTVRPITVADEDVWHERRAANAEWLQPWEATTPPGGEARPATFRELVQRLHRGARAGTTWPFVIEVDGRLAGQVTVSNVVRGSAQFASVGYWIGREFAGHGHVPVAVALVVDHAFTVGGLHRVEICVRPENANSIRVVEKLGLHEVGYAPRFLHIDGDWRDHRIFAVTREEVPSGLLVRFQSHQSQK